MEGREVDEMAMNFGDLLKRKLDDGNRGKGKLRKKNDEDNEDLNPFRKAKKKAYEKETDTIPVDEEGSDIEEMTEGEAGHTGEEKMGEGDHGVEDGEPIPAFLEKEDLKSKKKTKKTKKGDDEESEGFLDDEDAEGEEDLPSRKKKPSFAFRRYL